MPAPKDYYSILGVNETADAKAIKAAYHKLARQYHPDVSGKAGEEKFKDINEAYEVLSDTKKRQEYDGLRRGFAHRQARSRGAGFQRVAHDWAPGDLGDFGSIFDDLFSGASQSRREPSQARPVPEDTVRITLEQVATGTKINLSIDEVRPCLACHGRDPRCAACGGLGQVSEPKKFDVNVPAGIADGAVLRVGDHARLTVEVAPHPRFVRQGDHLVGRLMVSVPVAATGGEVSIKPLLGDPMMVKIPRHTNQGKTLRLRGMGLPHRGSASQGDMLLEVSLRFPEPFTDQDDQAYGTLREIHTELGGEIHAPR